MDRHSFLRGLLWLRPVTDEELHGPTGGQSSLERQRRRNSDSHYQQQTVQLLPPLDANTMSVSSWCCFNLGPRFCFFCPGERGEDQTQFELRLTLKMPIDESGGASPTLFARFDGNEVYAVDLAQITKVKMPRSPSTESHAPSNAPEPPPYGCLDFGNASLRVWLDPLQVSQASATDALQQALGLIQLHARIARTASSQLQTAVTKSEASWRSIYRHNQLLQNQQGDQIAILPSDFEKRAHELLNNDDDFEAVKMAVSKIGQGKRSRKRRLNQSDHDQDHEPGANRDVEEPYTNLEVIMLVTELCHVLGEDHKGLNQLLGFSDSSSCCSSHGRCFNFTSTVDSGDCLVSRWNAWEGFIELSQLVLQSKRKKSYSHHSKQPRRSNADSKTIHTAGMAWRHAIVEQQDAVVVNQRIIRLRGQIKAFEDLTFKHLYPTKQSWSNTSTDNVDTEATRRRREVMKQLECASSTRMLDFLREKRRYMLREELAAQLLPHRSCTYLTD